MTKLLVAVLTSGKPEKLERCLRSVNSNSSPHERIVVINTTNAAYISQATQIAFDHGFPVRVTESNGTPGRGKNSVMKHFIGTDADWLMQVDGDDYISDGAIARLHYEIDTNDFDAACLINNRALSPSGKMIYAYDIPMQPSVAKKFLKYASKEDFDLFIRAQDIGKKYSYDGKGLNRLLLVNKDVARKRKFNEQLKVTEDFLFLQEVKRNHTVHTVDANIEPIYIYDYADGITDELITTGELVQHLKMMLAFNADYDDE